MAWLFYKGEFVREVQTPTMCREHGIRGRLQESWPQDWGRDAVVVNEQESGYFMHWVPVGYFYVAGELKEISVYPTFSRHKWRDVIDLWFLLAN